MGKFKNTLFKFILPLAVIILLYNYNAVYGIVSLAAWAIFTVYTGRSTIYLFRGNISYSKGKMDEAVNWFRKAYETPGCGVKVAISYGYLVLKSGNVDEAYRVLSEVVNRKLTGEEKMSARSNLALATWKTGDLNGAISILEGIFEDYRNSAVYGSLGFLYILKGNLDKALEFNLEACEYNDTDTVILDNLGQTYYLRGDYDKALEVYEKLMGLNPAFAEAYYDYGLVLMEKKEYEKALDSMEKACKFRLYELSAITKEDIKSKMDEIEQMAAAHTKLKEGNND